MSDKIVGIICDNCDGECLEGYGDPDVALFCCNCAMTHAPKEFDWQRCERCEERQAESGRSQ